MAIYQGSDTREAVLSVASQRKLPCQTVDAAYLKMLFYDDKDSSSLNTPFHSIYCDNKTSPQSTNNVDDLGRMESPYIARLRAKYDSRIT